VSVVPDPEVEVDWLKICIRRAYAVAQCVSWYWIVYRAPTLSLPMRRPARRRFRVHDDSGDKL